MEYWKNPISDENESVTLCKGRWNEEDKAIWKGLWERI